MSKTGTAIIKLPARGQFDADTPIETLATAVCDSHSEIVRGLTSLIPYVIHAGDALIEAKKRLGHGKYTPFVEVTCGISTSTASRWVKTAQLHADGELTPEFILTGSVRKAERKKRKKPDPDTAKDEPGEKKKPDKPDAPDKPSKSKPEKKLTTGERVNKTIADGKQVYGVLLGEIQRLRREVKRLSQTELGSHIGLQRTDSGLVSAYQALKFSTPFNRCVYCARPGGEQEGCRACKGKGWLSRGLHRDAPQKLREMAAKK